MGAKKKLPKIEYKSWDDAWYNVNLRLRGGCLKVHYDEFSDDEDEVLKVEDFERIEDLRARFRFSSRQLQDEHCGQVKEGREVCASFSSEDEEVKFFDALVQKVCKSKHDLVDGDEICTCTFEVLWRAGPCASKTTSVSCENICLLTPGDIETHPVIRSSAKLIEEKFNAKVQSPARSSLKRKAVNMKESNTAIDEYKVGEPGKRTRKGDASDHASNCVVSEQEQVDNVSDICEQDGAIESPKSSKETVLPILNEVAENTVHSTSISSQSSMKEKNSGDELNSIENIVTGSEVLIEQAVVSSDNMENSVLSGFQTGSQMNTSNCVNSKIETETWKSTNLDANICSERNEIQFNSLRKEEKLGLDLNSIPVELDIEQHEIPISAGGLYSNILTERFSQISQSHVGSLSSSLNDCNIEGDNTHKKDKQFIELDTNIEISKNQMLCNSGWLDSDDSDSLEQENSGLNAVDNNIIDSSASPTVELINKENKLSEDHSLSICRDMKRPSSVLFMDTSEQGHNCQNVGEQLTMEENQKDNRTADDKERDKTFLASCWGKGKRQKHTSNEMFNSERQAQDYSERGENVKASKNIIKLGSDLCGVDTPSPGYLTTSRLKHNKDHSTMETVDCSTGMGKLVDQHVGNGEQIRKVVHECRQPVNQISNDEVVMQEIPIEVVEMPSEKKSHVSQPQNNDPLRSTCFSASHGKINIRNDLSDNFRDSADQEDQAMYKVDSAKCVIKHNNLNRKKMTSLVSLPEAVDISSDEENDHGTSKRRENKVLHSNGQHSDHVELHESLCTTERMKKDCACISETHKRVQSKSECDSFFRCKHEVKKNTSAIHHHCNGNSILEKTSCYSSDYSDATNISSLHPEHEVERCLPSLTCEECQKASPSSFNANLKQSELHIEHKSFNTCDQHGTCTGNGFTVCHEDCLLSSGCHCFKVYKSKSSASSEEESIFDGVGTSCFGTSGCRHFSKSLEPSVSCKKVNKGIQRGFHEDSSDCINADCAHCSEAVRTDERLFYYPEALVIDNLEKDVSTFDVKKAISCMSCNVVQVCILPSLKSEQFTRGFVWFQNYASLMKALGCLQDDSFFIVSSNGRPWVAHISKGVFGGVPGGFNIECKDNKWCSTKTSSSSKILLVRKGTVEYNKAQKRKNAFLEFREHFAILHKRLELEENQLVES